MSLANDSHLLLDSNTTCNVTRSPTHEFMGLIIMLPTMTLPGLVANGVSLFCIIPDIRRKRTLVKDLLLLLCIADIFGCLGAFIHHVTIMFNVPIFICAITSFLTTYFPLLSSMVATIMAAERVAALRTPYWYQHIMFKRKIWLSIILPAVLGAAICLFPQSGLGMFFKYRHYGCLVTKVCGSFPMGPPEDYKEAVFPIAYGVVGFLMVIVNLSFNVIVLRTLYEMVQRVTPAIPAGRELSQKFEMTKMLLALSATFLICWLPMNLQLLFVQLGLPRYKTLSAFFMVLLSANFTIDPFIYLFMKRKYRVKMKRILLCVKSDLSEASCQREYPRPINLKTVVT